MKLTDLFARGRKQGQHPGDIALSLSVANERTDRSSMADLVRLLREHDERKSGNDADA
jgi:hypothetical protein